MSRSDDSRVEDILNAIAKCRKFEPALDNADPTISRMAFDAICHNLSVIGEATAQLSNKLKDRFPDIDWKGIKGTQNYLIHQYFSISSAIIRDILTDDLEALSAALSSTIEPD